MTHSSSSLCTLGAALVAGSLAACSPGGSAPAPVNHSQVSLRQHQLSRADVPFDLRPLSSEPVPQPTGTHIINKRAAIRLGKAFFWDIQTGSDGKVACATCHAHNGADNRKFNTINPGYDGVFDAFGVTGPDQVYTSTLINDDTDDVVGTQGVARGVFVSVDPDPKVAAENCTPVVDEVFGTSRRVEFRQAPMIYGAAYFHELFWAGEANEHFNGITIWGFTGNSLLPPLTNEADVNNTALASQSVGPPHNSVEMSCAGRPFNGPNSLASKMLARPPLQFQHVSPDDSVLGELANEHGKGLRCGDQPCSYRHLIEKAFGKDLAANAENVFSMLWGEALQAYEMTLIPNRTPYDRYAAGHTHALTAQQKKGLDTFVKAKCQTCHAGPMFSDATVSFFDANGPLNRDGGDQGFHNIGLAETFTDGGRGVGGPANIPLSFSQSNFDNWAFKTPTLRNLKFTAPYFHNGGKPTLEDVVDFYNRGGDYPGNPEKSADIVPLNLSADEKTALVDFLRNALNDCRVEKHKAPFDHPALSVVNGVDLPAVGRHGTGECDGDEGDDD